MLSRSLVDELTHAIRRLEAGEARAAVILSGKPREVQYFYLRGGHRPGLPFAIAAHTVADDFITLHMVTGARALRAVSAWVDHDTAYALIGIPLALMIGSGALLGGVLIGTVSYLSPELVVDGKADARSDVYAAGVLIYEMLTGRKPHEGESPIQVAYKHVHEDVPPPSHEERIAAWRHGLGEVDGIAALGLWWIVVGAGLLILVRWLPSTGRHSSEAIHDTWSSGPGLSVLAHVGMFLGVCVFTWAYLTTAV